MRENGKFGNISHKRFISTCCGGKAGAIQRRAFPVADSHRCCDALGARDHSFEVFGQNVDAGNRAASRPRAFDISGDVEATGWRRADPALAEGHSACGLDTAHYANCRSKRDIAAGPEPDWSALDRHHVATSSRLPARNHRRSESVIRASHTDRERSIHAIAALAPKVPHFGAKFTQQSTHLMWKVPW